MLADFRTLTGQVWMSETHQPIALHGLHTKLPTSAKRLNQRDRRDHSLTLDLCPDLLIG
jgi:hypothetical protein